MITLILVAVLLAVLYVGIAIWVTKEIPESVSAMVYVLPDGGWRWLWTLWMWAVAFLLAPAMIESIGYDLQFIAFLTVANLEFCGALPLFMEEHHKAHNILGTLAGVMSQICVCLICPWWLFLWFAFATVRTKAVFFAELICFVTMTGALLCHYAWYSF